MNTAVLRVASVKWCSYVTNHNILSLHHNFTIHPSTGYMRVGHSPQYIFYELLVSPGVYIEMTMSGGLQIGWALTVVAGQVLPM